MNKQAARKTANYQKIRWLTNIAELIQIYYGLCVGYAVGHGIRDAEKTNIPNVSRTAPDFDSYSRRIKGSISGYMTFDATKNTGQKTSKAGIFVFSESLTFS